MKALFGLIIALSLSAAYAQTIQPNGGGGGSSGGTGSFSTLNVTSPGSSTNPSLSVGNSTTGIWTQGTTGLAFSVNGVTQLDFGISNSAKWTSAPAFVSSGSWIKSGTTFRVGFAWDNADDMKGSATSVFGWSGTVDDMSLPKDTGLARNAAGVVEVDTGTAGTFADLITRSYIGGGTPPTTAGSCSFGGFVGGNTVGTFTAQGCGTTSATAMVLVFARTAPNGWACDTVDRTGGGSPSVTAVVQNASTVTAASFKAVTVTGDVVQWKCLAY